VSEPTTTPEPLSARELLRDLPLFRHLGDQALTELEGELEFFALGGGQTLFAAGEPSDALYVLKSGSLGAFRAGIDGVYKRVGVVAAGETVGELGLIVDQPRSATVRALRDSELLRLSRAGFEKLVARHPESMLFTARLAMRRLLERSATGAMSAPRTFALLPHDPGVDARGFAEQLCNALGRFGECALIEAKTGLGQTSTWFSAIESRARFVVYLGDASAGAWRDLCVRQADCLLLLANAAETPSAWPEAACQSADQAQYRPRHLILLHYGDIRLGSAQRWLTDTALNQYHHVRRDEDISRIARLLIGRSVGLVLSGGGARGFAHLGVIKALREAGIQIDSVGGTSIGGIIGAGVAADWSTEEMLYVYRKAFVDGRPLSDYTFPFVSLVRGRRVSRLLHEAFGERDISDLVLPFFCVSANLTIGKAQVHRQGPLWFWLRASCAIPGVLPPVFYHGQVYVDGAVINNLPVDVMRELGIGDVVAVDIGADDVLSSNVEEFALPPWWRLAIARFGPHRRPGILSILLRSGMVNAEAASIERRAQTTVLLEPPMTGIDLLDWRSYDRAIDAGYQHALRVLGGRKDALEAETPPFAF
jgi:NTE family protein